MSTMVIHRKTSATGTHTLLIPVCPFCGDACTVCHSRNSGKGNAKIPIVCCLSPLAVREGQIQEFTPSEHKHSANRYYHTKYARNKPILAGKPE